MTTKKYFFDKLVLLLLSVLLFLVVVTILSNVLRLGTGQGIADYYIEYRQGPNHSVRGDFSPTGSVWSILNFVWFVVLAAGISTILSMRTYKIKREISLIALIFGIVLVLLATIVSNVLLGHR